MQFNLRFLRRSAIAFLHALTILCAVQLDLKRRDADPDVAGLVDEEEFAIVKSMKEKKKMYRDSFEELKQVKSEVEYLNRLVDQCRSKLVQFRFAIALTPVSIFLKFGCSRYLTLNNGLQVCMLRLMILPLPRLLVLTASLWMMERLLIFSKWNAS
jgi:hypothetical protein